MPRRDPFHVRRDNLLDVIDKAQELRDSMTYDEFKADWKSQYAATGLLVAIGEHMGNNTPHASERVAARFRTIRNLLAHEYFNVTSDRMWRAFDHLSELRDEVLQHREPPQDHTPISRP